MPQALERLNRLGISTTLVVTLKKGLNDGEIGRIIDFALKQPCVRGVTFQPIQAAGRLERFDPATDRLTLTEVRRRILEQTTLFRPEDVLPVPCHPDSLAMAYALKIDGQADPADRPDRPEGPDRRRTQHHRLRAGRRRARSGVQAVCHQPLARVERQSLRDLLCCLPRLDAPAQLGYGTSFASSSCSSSTPTPSTCAR